jgi:pyridoxine 5-phosphate synthase
MAGLTVLVDQVAYLRETIQSPDPEPLTAALLAESAGADGIGVYLREDHLPIRERDVRLLRQAVHSRLILFMAATSEMVGLALDVKPERVVLMPRMRDDGSVDYRFDVVSESKVIYETVDTLQSNGISVGVSIEPEPDQVKTVHQMRANWVHLYAGRLRSAATAAAQTQALSRIIDSVKMANRLRMHIAVGHGLDQKVIKLFAGVHEFDEFSMGRHLIARAVLVGMDRAVRDMTELIRSL